MTESGITRCELERFRFTGYDGRGKGCEREDVRTLLRCRGGHEGFAHAKRRTHRRKNAEPGSPDSNETGIVACNYCHGIIETKCPIIEGITTDEMSKHDRMTAVVMWVIEHREVKK